MKDGAILLAVATLSYVVGHFSGRRQRRTGGRLELPPRGRRWLH